MKIPGWYRDLNGIEKQKTPQIPIHTILESKKWETLPTDTPMISNEGDTSPTLEWKTKVTISFRNLRNQNEKQRNQMPPDVLY